MDILIPGQIPEAAKFVAHALKRREVAHEVVLGADRDLGVAIEDMPHEGRPATAEANDEDIVDRRVLAGSDGLGSVIRERQE